MARGRRPGVAGDSGTKDAIEQAARRQFAERGYPGTTIRSIAAEAGVDTRLVPHYFGSKQQLFVRVVELPFESLAVMPGLLAEHNHDLPAALAAFVSRMLASPDHWTVMTGMIRAAASEEDAAAMVRSLLTERMLGPMAQLVGGAHADLRIAMIGSQVAGMVLARHIVQMPALAHARPTQLTSVLEPVFRHYLTTPIPD